MSRIDDANGRGSAVISRVETIGRGAEYPGEPAALESHPPSSTTVRSRPRPLDDHGQWPAQARLPDEGELRALLIAGIARLIREPTTPETTRLAGLTLIGWLARRRPDEPAHSIGVEEARQSERQLRAARAKAR